MVKHLKITALKHLPNELRWMFVYKSSEFIENHSADFAILKWIGHMMGCLPRDYEN